MTGSETIGVPEVLDEEQKWCRATWDGKPGYARFLRKEETGDKWAFSLELPDWDGQHFSLTSPTRRNNAFYLAYVVRPGGVLKQVKVNEVSKKKQELKQLGAYTTDQVFETAVGFNNINKNKTLEL